MPSYRGAGHIECAACADRDGQNRMRWLFWIGAGVLGVGLRLDVLER